MQVEVGFQHVDFQISDGIRTAGRLRASARRGHNGERTGHATVPRTAENGADEPMPSGRCGHDVDRHGVAARRNRRPDAQRRNREAVLDIS